MKKFLAFILTMALVFTTTGAMTAFASEITESASHSTATTSTYGENSTSGTMYGGSTVYDVPVHVRGNNLTFYFSISGNDNLYVDVEVVDPNGVQFTAFRNVRCNGAVHKTSYSGTKTGDYYFTIRVNHGFSAGQEKDYTIKATW